MTEVFVLMTDTLLRIQWRPAAVPEYVCPGDSDTRLLLRPDASHTEPCQIGRQMLLIQMHSTAVGKECDCYSFKTNQLSSN